MPLDKWAAWPWGDRSAGEEQTKEFVPPLHPSFTDPHALSWAAVVDEEGHWDIHDQHQQGCPGSNQSLSVTCSVTKPAVTVLSWCLHARLLADDRAKWFWLQSTDCSRAEVPLQQADFLPATNQDGYIPFYPYIATITNSSPTYHYVVLYIYHLCFMWLKTLTFN